MTETSGAGRKGNLLLASLTSVAFVPFKALWLLVLGGYVL